MNKETIIKFINEFTLHDILMGRGSLYFNKNEIVISIANSNNKLSCGCPSPQLIRVMKNGMQTYEILKNIKHEEYTYGSNILQGKEWDSYWENLYLRHSFLRPILMKYL